MPIFANFHFSSILVPTSNRLQLLSQYRELVFNRRDKVIITVDRQSFYQTYHLESSKKRCLALSLYHKPTLYITVSCLMSVQILVTNCFFDTSVFAQEATSQDSGPPVTLIPALTQNTLTIVSLLIGTSSFILGPRI
jgi:hypothetical protein